MRKASLRWAVTRTSGNQTCTNLGAVHQGKSTIEPGTGRQSEIGRGLKGACVAEGSLGKQKRGEKSMAGPEPGAWCYMLVICSRSMSTVVVQMVSISRFLWTRAPGPAPLVILITLTALRKL